MRHGTTLGRRQGELRRSSARGRIRRGRRRAVLAVLGLLALGLALDAVWVGTTLAREARALRRDLVAGAGLLEEGRVRDAATRFDLARRAAGTLSGAMRHPTAILAGVLPGLADDVRAARALADASAEMAASGAALVRAAERVGWDGRSVPGLVAPGQVDLVAIAEAEPPLRSAAEATERARALLRAIPTSGLAGPLREALEQARDEVEARAPALARAAAGAELLPRLLGADGPRRYLLIAQNLSDPRGSGGHVGSHGILTAEDGRPSLGPMAPTVELRPGPPVEVPPDLERRYGRFGTLTRPMAATYPPDFRTVGRILVAGWAARGEEPLDGVISVDAVFMGELVAAIGPVETPAWPEPLTAENTMEVLARGTFETGDADRSNALQAALAQALWRAALGRTPALRPFLGAISRASAERHLQVYSAHPEEEALLEELGVAGAVPETDHPLQVVWFGGSDNRAGYFAEKTVEYVGVLSPDGWAEVRLVATLRNGAPAEGPPSILLGVPGPTFGWFHALVNVYLPPDARVLDLSGGTLQLEEREAGRPVVVGLLGSGPGGSSSFHVRYRTQAAERLADGSSRFVLDVLPQPALRPDLVRVQVELPPGVDVLGTSPGVRVEAGVVIWQGRPTTPQHLWVRYR